MPVKGLAITAMNDKTILVWFRNDLRLHDNETLTYALNKAAAILPVYCFDVAQFRKTGYSTLKTGSFRAAFLLESVSALREALRQAGAELLIRFGDPAAIIPQLAREYDVKEVVHQGEVTDEENKLSARVEAELWKIRTGLTYVYHSTLYHKADLPFPVKDIPDIFSNFRKKLERECTVRVCFDAPAKIVVPPVRDAGELPSIAQLGLAPTTLDKRAAFVFKGGEGAALHRLNYYLWETGLLSNYKNTRNGLLGADYSTKLSAWLSLGCISPRKVYAEVKRYEMANGANESTYWLFFELLWRDFFYFMFKKYGNLFFKSQGLRGQAPPTAQNQAELFESWKKGQTGVPFVDANMRELNATGFMSNRGRQNVASFLVKDLKVNWTWGAAYFEEMLIDYCPASNWGNWAYVAGVANDPRENRYFNVIKQAGDYDPQGAYVRTWIPELKNLPGRQIHIPFFLTDGELKDFGIRAGVDYPGIVIEPRWKPFAKTDETLFG